MAHSHAGPWMVIAVPALQKGPDPYLQSEALAACANPDPLFQTLNGTLQTTRRNEMGAIRGTHFLATLFMEKKKLGEKKTVSKNKSDYRPCPGQAT